MPLVGYCILKISDVEQYRADIYGQEGSLSFFFLIKLFILYWRIAD